MTHKPVTHSKFIQPCCSVSKVNPPTLCLQRWWYSRDVVGMVPVCKRMMACSDRGAKLWILYGLKSLANEGIFVQAMTWDLCLLPAVVSVSSGLTFSRAVPFVSCTKGNTFLVAHTGCHTHPMAITPCIHVHLYIRPAEAQTQHQNGEDRWFLWTRRGCWCQMSWSEYFGNCWCTGITHSHRWS